VIVEESSESTIFLAFFPVCTFPMLPLLGYLLLRPFGFPKLSGHGVGDRDTLVRLH